MQIVAAAIICEYGRYLVARRGQSKKLAGKWEFPGGKVENGESLENCLERELLEELGVSVQVGKVVIESQYRYDHGEFLIVAIEAKLISKDLTLTVHDAVKWLTPQELLDLDLSPADIPIALFLAESSHVSTN
jgi:8-oxo-dGTP diphosphatase